MLCESRSALGDCTYNGFLLTEAQRDQVDIVLVSPRNPLNIGAVARAMANFGFARLAVVASYEAHWREARSAVGAPELLQRANESATLAEAVAACTLVVGTGTLTHRKAEQSVVPLPELAPLICAEIEHNGHVAIIFGSEKRGLTREDLSRCHLLVEIPTDERQPSMNLGQAVAVCLYELARGIGRTERAANWTKNEHRAVTSGELDRLAEVVEQTMTAVRYSPQIMEAANRHDLRLLLRRLSWTEGDAKRALGLFRHILRQIEHFKR
jgi:tRNA/rRNA methyltransferase